MLTQFDAFLIVFFLMVAVLLFGALGLWLDSILDPPCRCGELRRQERELEGVEV